MLGQLLPITERLLQLAEMLHFQAFNSIRRSVRLMMVLGGKQLFYSARGVFSAGLGITLLFPRRLAMPSFVDTAEI